MNVAVYSSTLTLVGLIIGAALQYHFNRAIELRRQVIVARTECYVDYIRCIAQFHRVAENPAKLAKWNAQVLEARARICIYGSHEVIKALALFERSSDPVMSDAYVDNVLNVLTAMRKHTDDRPPRGLRGELRDALFRNLGKTAATEDLRGVGTISLEGVDGTRTRR
jgi:hypothetical protein